MSLLLNRSLEKNKKKIFILNIDLEKTNQKLQEQALKDPLTSLHNRRYLNGFLAIQGEIYKRELKSFSIIITDIDYFKDVNDKYGHLAGDKILTEFSRLLINVSRPSDIIVRYGGEEFLLVCTDTNLKSAFVFAERIRKTVENNDFLKDKIRITTSFGIAEYKEEEPIEDLLKRADVKLYEAKESGRNRCKI